MRNILKPKKRHREAVGSAMMRLNLSWSVWVLAVIVLPLVQITAGSTLGATVNIEVLDRDTPQQVRAHYSVVSSLPCSALDQLCKQVNCVDQLASSPVKGRFPSPGWCLRRWQTTIPSNHMSTFQLGSDGALSLYSRADLSVRSDTNDINQPPYVSLPPPVRLQAGCPQEIPVYAMDLDGDEIRCRYEKTSPGGFLQLNEETCTLSYEGGASLGQYSIQILVEDFPPSVKNQIGNDAKPFSTVSLHLLITVENGAGCSAVPEFTGASPEGGAVIHVLPFEELRVNVTVDSSVESRVSHTPGYGLELSLDLTAPAAPVPHPPAIQPVLKVCVEDGGAELTISDLRALQKLTFCNVSEIAVTGPPGLFITPVETGQGFQSSTKLSWVRGPNQFAHLLSICFAANTQSLQSYIRCIWVQQTQTDPLPPGTELKCKEKELQMSVVLPISFLENLHFSGLQLNDPTCPVFYNTTHVTTTFSLTGCGTKRMHLGSELLYTNTLRSINPNSTISRVATLILPVACRIPGQQAKGPSFKISIPEEVKIFGEVSFWLEIHLPGEGPMAAETRLPRMRSLQPVREVREVRTTSRMEMLDLHVFSNCSLARAELMVGSCVESETQDFTNTRPLLNQGCAAGNGTLEILTSTPTVRIFRLYLSSLDIKGDTMYVQCLVHLCITTKQSQRCPDPCTGNLDKMIVDNILTRNYTVRSGPVSLINKATENDTTTAKPTQAVTQNAANSQVTTASGSCSLDRGALWITAVSVAVLVLKKLTEDFVE